jgi:hypothetical protein
MAPNELAAVLPKSVDVLINDCLRGQAESALYTVIGMERRFV